MIKYKCSQCRNEMESPTGMAGQTEVCPTCQMPNKVPTPRKRTRKFFVENKELHTDDKATKECLECKETINAEANICPHCRSKQPSAFQGVWLLVKVCLVFGVGITVWYAMSQIPSCEDIESRPEPKVSDARMAEMDKKAENMLSSQAVHSIDVDMNIVRVDPLLWDAMSLETKQDFVAWFSMYFDAKGSTGRVTVLGNRNDVELGSYSVWSGIEIKR